MASQGTEIVKQLLVLGAFLQRQAGRELAGFGLKQQQFVVLKEIEERGPVNQTALCSALLFEKSNISKIVAKLERLGLVRKTAHAPDNRMTVVSVSRKGSAVIRECMKGLDRWNSDWLAGLSDATLEAASAALSRLTELTKEQI